jgi:catechol 2,3-dioxygenase-like lactoylglutathione lyase family enzyme
VTAASFAIAPEAIDYWKARFKEHHVLMEEAAPRFGDAVLRFPDPDGLMLELIAADRIESVDLNYEKEVPKEFALHGFQAPTLEVESAGLTVQLLTETFGFQKIAQEGSRARYSVEKGSPSKQLDLIERPEGFGNIAPGTVHHIAFRAANDEEQMRWREKLAELGFGITPVIDRQYFHSVYFREPGGILFEIATDGPGFAIDEPIEHLGESLKLPPQFEKDRAMIEQSLPPISLPRQAGT